MIRGDDDRRFILMYASVTYFGSVTLFFLTGIDIGNRSFRHLLITVELDLDCNSMMNWKIFQLFAGQSYAVYASVPDKPHVTHRPCWKHDFPHWLLIWQVQNKTYKSFVLEFINSNANTSQTQRHMKIPWNGFKAQGFQSGWVVMCWVLGERAIFATHLHDLH